MSGLYRKTGARLAPIFLFLLVLLAAGCQAIPSPEQLAELANNTLTTPEATADPTTPLPLDEAQPPVSLQIAELGLTLPIEPMGWVVTESNGQRTTDWLVPTDAVGWQANSAGVGGAGNLILAGHQALGSAVLAPLALGDIAVGQTVELTTSDGTVFAYRIVEISEPIPILGATEADNALARSYVQPSETPILTMMTGWPDFTTTHRIFAVAEYLGRES